MTPDYHATCKCRVFTLTAILLMGLVAHGTTKAQTAPPGHATLDLPAPGYSRQVCFESLPRPIDLQPVDIGCGLLDCCPGCPGITAPWRNDADLKISLSGDFAQSIVLNFENLDASQVDALLIPNGTRLDDTRVEIERGSTTIEVPDSHIGVIRIIPAINVTDDVANAIDNGLGIHELRFNTPILRVDISTVKEEQVFGRFAYAIEAAPCRVFELPPDQCRDTVEFGNGPANHNSIVLLDGRTVFGCLNDSLIRGGSEIGTGNFMSPLQCRNEMLVLAHGHEPFILADQNSETWNVWTDAAGDNHQISWDQLRNPVSIPLNPVIASADPHTTALLLESQVIEVARLFEANYANLRITLPALPLSAAVVTDTDKISEIAEMADKVWADDVGNLATFLSPLVNEPDTSHYSADELNVYFVDSPAAMTGAHLGVDDGSSSGVIFIGPNPGPATLTHEIGHALSLNHVGGKIDSTCEEGNACPSKAADYNRDGIRDFATDNIMFVEYTGRDRFTEGQIYRMFVDETSYLNTAEIRPTGSVTRDCPDKRVSGACLWLGFDPADAE
jgi:hypothetical protein